MTNSSRFSKAAALVLLFALSLCTAAQAVTIRVGILNGVTSAAISGQGLSASAGGRKISVPKSFTVKASAQKLVVNGKTYASPLILTSSKPIGCDKTSYEGEIVVRASGSRLTVVNKLDVEKYLRGVLGYEISPSWHLEVLKAQAMISRTYALSQMGRHNSEGFDVCAADHCQVYRGVNVHSSSTDRAITQTRGKVVTYKGALAHTYFSSDSGGATSDSADVWGSSIPYLIVRAEPYPSPSPNAEWQVTLTAAEIQTALSKKGKGVGTLKEMAIARRDSAGRPVVLRFTGSKGSSTLTSAEFRTQIGAKKVRSTFFEFSRAASAKTAAKAKTSASSSSKSSNGGALTSAEKKKLLALIAKKIFSDDERLEMILNPELERYYLDKALGKSSDTVSKQTKKAGKSASYAASGVSSVKVSGSVTLYGRGWGHGVGLSQWGAKAMADHGWSAEKILNFYYPGTVIQKR